MRRTLSRSALLEKLLHDLRGGPGSRDLAAIDIHLSYVAGEPNWDAEVDGVESSELEEVKRKLSHYDLKVDEG
jgi:hypothetical protein